MIELLSLALSLEAGVDILATKPSPSKQHLKKALSGSGLRNSNTKSFVSNMEKAPHA